MQPAQKVKHFSTGGNSNHRCREEKLECDRLLYRGQQLGRQTRLLEEGKRDVRVSVQEEPSVVVQEGYNCMTSYSAFTGTIQWETFKGENFREFCGFVTIHEISLYKIWGRDILRHGKCEDSTKVFSVKIIFCKSFLPRKFSAIGYSTLLACPTMIYAPPVHTKMSY